MLFTNRVGNYRGSVRRVVARLLCRVVTWQSSSRYQDAFALFAPA